LKIKSRYVISIAFLMLLSSCQAFFTYSPLAFLQRQPADLSYEQRLQYAEDAIASGNAASMQAAYASLASIQTSDAQYMAAELSLELSGFPQLLLGLIGNTVSLYPGSLEEIQTFIDDNSVSPDLLIASVGHMQDALSLGGTLDPIDYVFGSLGLLFDAAPRNPDGSIDLSNPAAVDFTEAIAFMAQGINDISELPASDPGRVFLSAFSDFLNSF
jgi:hypothetical protein